MAVSIERNLPAVNFSGNPMVLRVSSNNFEDSGIPRPFFAIFCSIYLEDPSGEGTPEPVHVESIQVDASGHGLFDLSDVLSGYTKPTLPFPLDFTVQAVKDEEAAVRFWIELYEGYGIPFVKQAVAINSKANYLAIPGGFSDTILQQIEEGESNQYAFLNANKLFLSNQPEYKRVANLQPETLRWFNCSGEQVSAKLICKQYSFIGEDAVTEQPWSGTLDALSLHLQCNPGNNFRAAAEYGLMGDLHHQFFRCRYFGEDYPPYSRPTGSECKPYPFPKFARGIRYAPMRGGDGY